MDEDYLFPFLPPVNTSDRDLRAKSSFQGGSDYVES
jgi:hypothetical protein